MNEYDSHAWSIIIACLGQEVNGLARIHFCYGEEADTEDGPLEVRFSNGVTLLFKAGGGGDYLVVEQQPWHDNFANWPRDKLAQHIAEFGAYRRFNIAEDSEFAAITGRKLSAVSPIKSQFGRLVGIEMRLEGFLLTVYCAADEEYVWLGECRKRLLNMGASIGDARSILD
ncbi:MAG: hypothetical protein MJE77_17430 [Proteobacteria bacterium]|nr:hypothetical protein [Pseudomonadota bacterium]